MAVMFALLSCGIAGLIYVVLFLGSRESSLPPGPPTLPLIGNLHQIPKKAPFLQYTKWAKHYGGIFSLKFATGTAIILTDRRLVKELLDKRGSKYSGRPPSYVGNDLVTHGDHLILMSNDNTWRALRRVIHEYFSESVVERVHLEVQNAEAVQLIRDFLLHPEQHMLHPKRYSNSIIMSLLFGIRTPTLETSHMKRLYTLINNWSELMEPGSTPPVDMYPFLRWIPERFLGNWVSRAFRVRDEMKAFYGDMLDRVEKRRKIQGSTGSFMDGVLDQNEKHGFSRRQLYFLGGTLMEGGADTSSSVILVFIHAMTRWRNVMIKAQTEIDSVVPEDRSPLWSDYAQLPYVAQIVKETMRWRPVAPIVFPHVLSEDDLVDGYLLRKGTMIFLNTWGLHHDEAIFPDPDIFDPYHYAGQTALAPELAASSDYQNRDHYGYGAGRRLCPGIHLAERNLFLALAKLLWAFDFEAGLSVNGEVVEPDFSPETGYRAGFLISPLPFACKTTPRSEVRRRTMLLEYEKVNNGVFRSFESG